MSYVRECPDCEVSLKRGKCPECGWTEAQLAKKEPGRCAWPVGARHCLLWPEWYPHAASTTGFCDWHSEFRGASGALIAQCAVDDFAAFCQWWESWYGPTAPIPYCSSWTHFPVGDLWARLHGEPGLGSPPTACRVASCPHRRVPPFTSAPKAALAEIHRALSVPSTRFIKRTGKSLPPDLKDLKKA